MKANIMKSSIVLLFLVLFAIDELAAGDQGKPIFEDSFERAESVIRRNACCDWPCHATQSWMM